MTIDKNNKTAVIDISTDVLIISSAVEVFKLAIDIANAGYKTMVAGKHELSAVSSIAQECGVKILHKEILVNLSGVPGNFKVTFKKDNETVQRIFGAIVVAGHYEVELLNESYGLKFLNNVITLSKLEEILHDYKPEINNIAFLAGFAHEGTVLDTKRVLKCMSTLQDMEEINTYLYINNIKVAQHDVEKEFTTVRDKGAITFKLTEMPQITQTESSLKILFQDPVIRKTVEHSPDLIVVEDRMIPAGINAEIAQILKIDITKSGFLQKDNVHRFPVQSNREGIFVTGHARDVMTYSEYLIDSDNVVLRVKEFLGNGEKSVPLNKAVVNDDKCTICLTCYRCCPHGAIEIDGDRAVISSIACQGCGICASECPMDAIQIIGFNDDDLKVEIKNATHGAKDKSIIVFCCQNSAMEAWEMAKAFNAPLPDSMKIIEVPCAGKVDAEYILSAFVEGADGVMVIACHEGNCKAERGNTFAKWRVNDLYNKMEKIGLDKQRLKFATVASNMGKNFADLVGEMSETVSKLALKDY